MVHSYVLKFGTYGIHKGQLNCAIGITIHSGKVYVIENSGNRISVFHYDGQFSHIIGSGHFNCPWFAAVSNDQLLVADWHHNCISIFTLDGSYVGNLTHETLVGSS